MTDTSDRIAEHIRTDPGIHFNEIVRTLDLAPGQVQYHLNTFLGNETLDAEKLYGRTHYYPPSYDDWERSALALLRRETAGDIVAYLLENGSARPEAVADDLDIARSTLEWHLNHLVEQDLVRKQRDRRNHVTIVPARPEQTIHLLSEAQPTLPGRMVDRFTRLADRLFFE